MLHDKVDIQRWDGLFSLDSLKARAREKVMSFKREDPTRYANELEVEDHIKFMYPEVSFITSPDDIAIFDQFRKQDWDLLVRTGAQTRPTDVFVFSKGEPSNRAITKVGGLPFWPQDKSWPCLADGKPQTFIAQFCFADSKDIVGELPGDVLLLFGDIEEAHYCEPDNLSFYWMNLGESNLIHQQDIPKTPAVIRPCYGSIYRTVDFDLDYFEDIYDIEINGRLLAAEGTKIGGFPKWIQEPEGLPGKLLAALGSVQPDGELPYPWINQPKPLDYFEGFSKDLLSWGDAGSIFIFITEEGELSWEFQCY